MYKKLENKTLSNRKKIKSSKIIKKSILPSKLINNNKKDNSNNSISSIKDNDYSGRNRTLSMIRIPKNKNGTIFSIQNDMNNNNNELNNNNHKYHFEDFKYSKHFGNIDKCPICQAQKIKNKLLERNHGVHSNFIREMNLTPIKKMFEIKKKKRVIKHIPLKSRNDIDIKSIDLNEFEKAKLEFMKFGNGGLFSNNKKEKENDAHSNSTYSDKYSAILQYFKPSK